MKALASSGSSMSLIPVPSTSQRPLWAIFHKPVSADFVYPVAKKSGYKITLYQEMLLESCYNQNSNNRNSLYIYNTHTKATANLVKFPPILPSSKINDEKMA